MGTMYDYLKWRGDILFSQLPVNPADTLIFSTLSYLWFDHIVPDTAAEGISLKKAAEQFFLVPGHEKMVRSRQDLRLLKEASASRRFGKTQLTFYRNIFDAQKETQFAAMTCFLDDHTAVLVFRGTDKTLAGWKEDFNMTFHETVPAQIEALRYVKDFARESSCDFYLTGHSKGGNIAVYAAAKSEEAIQKRILKIYNHDGPGFNDYLMGDPGYLSIVPKIRTYIPQSSVVGMLLQHEEPYAVVKSRQFGLMQHDPYSWEILGAGFVLAEEVSKDSAKLDKALKSWFAGMSAEERSQLIDTVYEVLTENGARRTKDLVRPGYVGKYMKTLRENNEKKAMLDHELAALLRSFKEVRTIQK